MGLNNSVSDRKGLLVLNTQRSKGMNFKGWSIEGDLIARNLQLFCKLQFLMLIQPNELRKRYSDLI